MKADIALRDIKQGEMITTNAEQDNIYDIKDMQNTIIQSVQNNIGKWVIIDPKGVLGDETYEVASFILNPIPELLEYIVIYNEVCVIKKEEIAL